MASPKSAGLNGIYPKHKKWILWDLFPQKNCGCVGFTPEKWWISRIGPVVCFNVAMENRDFWKAKVGLIIPKWTVASSDVKMTFLVEVDGQIPWKVQGGAPVRNCVQLVYKYYFTFGLMNGGEISIVFMGFINQQTSLGGHHLVDLFTMLRKVNRWNRSVIKDILFLFCFGRSNPPVVLISRPGDGSDIISGSRFFFSCG